MNKLPKFPISDKDLALNATIYHGAKQTLSAAYPKGFVYDQMQFNPHLASYEIDPNFCTGCAVANAVQGLLESVGINATGDYAKRLYEIAMRDHFGEAHDKRGGGIRIGPVLDAVEDVFGSLLKQHGVQIHARRIRLYQSRWWIANKSPVIAAVRWTEGMAYPAPAKVTGFWAKIREFFRGPRWMSGGGAYMGNHAVCLTGLREKRGAYVVENSYGLGWGMKGRALMEFSQLPSESELWGLELLEAAEA
jgi:hypothetical protein